MSSTLPATTNLIPVLLCDLGIARTPEREFLLSGGPGLVILAFLINQAAKMIDYEWYDYKEDAIRLAASENIACWSDSHQGIVYFETVFGQFSFHVFEDFDFNLVPDRANNPAYQWSKHDNDIDAVLADVFNVPSTLKRWGHIEREKGSEYDGRIS